MPKNNAFCYLIIVLLALACKHEKRKIDDHQYTLTEGDSIYQRANKGLRFNVTESTLFDYRLAMGIFKYHRDWVRYMEASKELGSAYLSLKEYDSCIYFLKNSMQIGLQHPDTTTLPFLINVYHRIGTYYGQTGDFDSSYWYLQKALAERKRLFGPAHRIVAKSYISISRHHSELKEPNKSMAYQDSAYHIIKDENSAGNGELATYYNNRAFDYFNLSEYYKGLPFLDKASAIMMSMQLVDNHLFKLKIYKQYGDFNYGVGNLKEAVEWYTKVIDAPYQKRNSRIIAKASSQLGKIFIDSNPGKALEFHNRSITLIKGIVGESHKSLADEYLKKGDFFLNTSQYDSAVAIYEKTQSMYASELGGNSLFVADTYRKLAEALLKQGNTEKAFDNIQKSIEIYTFINEGGGFDPLSDVYKCFHTKAKIQEERGELRAAFDNYWLAVDILDERKAFYSNDSRLHFSKVLNEVYQDVMPLAVKLYQANNDQAYLIKAFQIAEKNRAHTLLENVLTSQASQFAGIPDDLVQKEHRIKEKVTMYNDLLAAANEAADPNIRRLENLKKAKFETVLSYDSLLGYFEKNYPNYYQLKNQKQAVPISKLQGGLRKNELLIEYFLGDKDIYTFVVGVDGFEVVVVDKGKGFEKNCIDFYKAINKYDKTGFLKYSRALYAKLIAPIEDYLSGMDKLSIVPHNELAYLPFGALVTDVGFNNMDFSKAPFLIKQFELGYHYSSTLKSHWHKGTLKSKGFVGFGPVADGSVSAQNEAGQDLEPLKESKVELLTIAKNFDIQNTKTIFNSDASEGNFRSMVGRYRYVHLATHTILDRDKPERSYVCFAGASSRAYGGDDGKITMAESYNLHLNAELMVLSSCESGFGKLVRGEGMLSFTRGFSYSGAKNVLCSLWKVNDKMTRKVMVGFYDEITSNRSFSKALQLSKIALAKNQATAFPKNWAGFVLIGGS